MEQKTVFISYCRAVSKHLARLVYQDLKMNGWDVFLDVNTVDSGDFDRIILNQIGARAYFILLISPDSLERCANAGDWVLREIQEAVRLERNIVPIIEEGADFFREISFLPDDLRISISKKNSLPLPHFFFEAAVEMLRNRFLRTPDYVRITAPPVAERAEVERRMAAIDTPVTPPRPVRPSSLDLMPAPFAWVDIPGIGYSIAKYPTTNAQFKLFIDAGGYRESKWWTEAGWKVREEGWHNDGGWKPSGKAWTEPRYWNDAKWNGAQYPVVGVSWYESVAFCQWLSDVSGEKIMLPAEDQWQYAAQGDDGREYPWGKTWDASRCNNNVDGKGIGKTTPVRQYEGKGDSPFGVVDMAGNVVEWCLTGYDDNTNDMNSSARFRYQRGGSYVATWTGLFCCDYLHYRRSLYFGSSDCGFRVSRS